MTKTMTALGEIGLALGYDRNDIPTRAEILDTIQHLRANADTSTERTVAWVVQVIEEDLKRFGMELLWTDGGGSECPTGWRRKPYVVMKHGNKPPNTEQWAELHKENHEAWSLLRKETARNDALQEQQKCWSDERAVLTAKLRAQEAHPQEYAALKSMYDELMAKYNMRWVELLETKERADAAVRQLEEARATWKKARESLWVEFPALLEKLPK